MVPSFYYFGKNKYFQILRSFTLKKKIVIKYKKVKYVQIKLLKSWFRFITIYIIFYLIRPIVPSVLFLQ